MATISMCTGARRTLLRLNVSSFLRSWMSRSQQRALTTAAPGENVEEPEAKATDETAGVNPVAGKVAELEETFRKEKEELQKDLTEYQDKYKRSLAEAENVRQRMQKQIQDTKLFGIQGFCKDLLEVADILGAATSTVPEEEVAKNAHLKTLYEGLTMTESQLQKVFLKHGLNKLEPDEGDKFDPHIHEALFEQPLEGKTPGTIATVTKIGYRLHDRTLRPALVGVVKRA